MHFLLILAVLSGLIVSENLPARPVGDAAVRFFVAVAGTCLAPLLAAIASAWLAGRLKADWRQREAVLRGLRMVRSIHAALWLAVAFAVLFGLGWGRIVRFNWHLQGWFLLDEALILTPVLLPVILSWAAFYEVDHELRQTPGAVGPVEEDFSRRQYVVVHVRHYLGLLLIPVVGLLAVQDAAELLIPGFRETSGAGLVYLGAMVLIFLFFPCLLRRLWNTQPLPPGPLRTRLEGAARRAGFRARDILVWHTDRMIVNAAVAGLLPRFRYVFLTDELLAQLREEEIQAVFGHEIGHMRHRHLLLRVAAMAAPVSLWVFLRQVVPGIEDQVRMHLSYGALGLQLQWGMVGLLALASYMLLVFGPYCRLLEGQADLFGCRTLAWGAASEPVETFIEALENLAVASGIDRERTSWQHASIARRVEFLKRVAKDPDYEHHFQRRVRWLSGLIVGAVVAPLGLQLLLGG